MAEPGGRQNSNPVSREDAERIAAEIFDGMSEHRLGDGAVLVRPALAKMSVHAREAVISALLVLKPKG